MLAGRGSRTVGEPTPPPTPSVGRQRRFALLPLHRLTAAVLVVGIVVSAGLWMSARFSYNHDEQHLTTLETELTATSLGVAQVDLERRLGGALDLAEGDAHPGAAFRQAIAPSMAPKGPFAAAGLQILRAGHVAIVATLGGKPIVNLHSARTTALFNEAARTKTLVTSHVVGHGQQRLAYLLALHTTRGTLVAVGAQELPANRRLVVPASSPDAGLFIAVYFGATTATADLIETNAPHIPLGGATATARIPFGNNVLTLVAAARTSLDGGWSQAVPWGILVVGIVFTLAIAAMTERLVRRRQLAENLAIENSTLFREQRDIAVTLQRAVLPKRLPRLAGVEFAARYLPAAAGVDVGGDWYSAIRSGETTFAFVVGDVSGKGAAAAAVTASLRYTIRTLAALGYAPGEILARTAEELRATGEENFATVLVGAVDLKTRALELASAGHLPPLLLDAGTAAYLEVPIGPPLGLAPYPYATARSVLPARATLLGYTDGLVERRGRILDEGLERLRACVPWRAASLEELLTHVLDECGAARAEDDIAILAIRLSGARPIIE